jgi:hypothetical protein
VQATGHLHGVVRECARASLGCHHQAEWREGESVDELREGGATGARIELKDAELIDTCPIVVAELGRRLLAPQPIEDCGDLRITMSLSKPRDAFPVARERVVGAADLGEARERGPQNAGGAAALDGRAASHSRPPW